MINQQQMAEAFEAAEAKASTAKTTAKGVKDGNTMRVVCNNLKRDLILAGLTEKAAWRIACWWVSDNT